MERALYFFVLLIIPVSFYIKTIEILYILGFVYIYLITFLAKKNFTNVMALNKTVLTFFLFMLITILSNSYFYMIDPVHFKEFLSPYFRLWFYFFIFIISYALINTKSKLDKLISSVIFSSFIPNIVGLVQLKLDIFTIVISNEGARRIGSTMAHPNFYGYYLVVLLICMLYKATSTFNIVLKNSLYLYSILVFFLLYNTNSRTTFFLGLFLFIINIYFSSKSAMSSKKLKYLRLLFLLITIVFIITISIYVLKSGIITETRYNFIENSGSFQWRIVKWRTAIEYWINYPIAIIVGFGWMSSFVFSTNELYEEFAMHNEYIRILFETGVLGVIAFITFLIMIFMNITKIEDKAPKRFFYSIFFLFAIGSLTGNLLGVPENTFYFIIFFAITINYRKFKKAV